MKIGDFKYHIQIDFSDINSGGMEFKEMIEGLKKKRTDGERFSVYWSKSVWKEFRALCDREGLKPSAVLEHLMREMLKSEGKKK